MYLHVYTHSFDIYLQYIQYNKYYLNILILYK